MLEIENLWARVNNREVLKGVNLSVGKGETHVLMGPNACGKTSLILTIMGYPAYEVTQGSIVFEGQDLLEKGITERAKLGIALGHQNPPAIRGVKLRDIIRFIQGEGPWNPAVEPEEKLATRFLGRVDLEPESFLARDINLGFSGGEKRRAELAQVFAMESRLMILDEPDSGVDIDSIRLIGREISKQVEEQGSSVLIITHHRHILQHLSPDVAHIMYEGQIIDSGEPEKLIPKIEEKGYDGYIGEVAR